jgi:hypothetical protein
LLRGGGGGDIGKIVARDCRNRPHGCGSR